MQLTDADYHKATRLIARRDPMLGAVIRTIGPCGLPGRQRDDHLTALISAIVSQQLSTKAAATIFRRFVGALSRRRDHRRGDDRLVRRCGAARRRVERPEGRLRAGSLRPPEPTAGCASTSSTRCRMRRSSIRLTEVKGFGRWTAEMFLMFRLLRPDVLPVGDLGIVNAIQRVYRLRKRPDAEAHAGARRGVAPVPDRGVLVSVAEPAARARRHRQKTVKPRSRGSRGRVEESQRLKRNARAFQEQQQVAGDDRDQRPALAEERLAERERRVRRRLASGSAAPSPLARRRAAISAPAACTPDSCRPASPRAAFPPSGRWRGTRGRRAATITGTSQSRLALTAKPVQIARLPR